MKFHASDVEREGSDLLIWRAKPDGLMVLPIMIRDIVVTKQPFRELKARTAGGDLYLCGLNRTYANDQALRELGTVFSP